jgi:hypothetical protein
MIAVYADETGTHGIQNNIEPAPGIFGFLATQKEWEQFRIKWKTELQKHTAPHFHYRELNNRERSKNKNSPFYGWDDKKTEDFIYDMAIIASSGPIPLGGSSSEKRFINKEKAYHETFKSFFGDFKSAMNAHFQKTKETASFFFSEIDSKQWISILDTEIKKARKHDSRIGEYTLICPKTELGIPCQAADLFAHEHRLLYSKMYDEDRHLPLKNLAFILARKAHPPRHPLRKFYDRFSDENKWRELIVDLRSREKLKASRNIFKTGKEQIFYPWRDHPVLRLQYREIAMQVKQYENKRRN